MPAPPRFAELPRPVQVQLAAGGPLLFGAVCGFVLSISAAGWWILQVPAVAGGLLGGMEHDGARQGARRGLIAGVLFGAGVVVAHALSGRAALAPVPSPTVLLILVTAVIGAGLGALGGAARRRMA